MAGNGPPYASDEDSDLRRVAHHQETGGHGVLHAIGNGIPQCLTTIAVSPGDEDFDAGTTRIHFGAPSK